MAAIQFPGAEQGGDRHLPGRGLLLVAATLFLLAGCAGLPEQAPVSTEDLAWAAGGAGMLAESDTPVLEDPASLLRVTDEMRRFARRAVLGNIGIADRSRALSDALNADDGLHLQYDAEATLPAEQAFSQRRANCLSYTFLFVALAREVDIPVRFNDVDIPPIWGLGDETTSLLYRHLNVRVDLDHSSFQVVDMSGDEYDPTYIQSVISDNEALAQFYNNRAVELRLHKRIADALRYQVKALELAPSADYLWTNLANLYLVSRNSRAAGIAINRALSLNPSSMMNYSTAEQVYDQLGDHQLAQYFHERALHFLDQNPYLHYQLALAALQRNDNALAYKEAYRAISLYQKDGRFFFLISEVLDRLGKTTLALESMQAAIELTPDLAQQDRYRSKFARIPKSAQD
jgi:tetratricopeptide (TPR) repeat protein